MAFRVGDTVGPYEVISLLGTGGVGRVFKVKHTVTGRVEAMKVLLKHNAGSKDHVQRFQREIRLQASLQHPHIAAVHNAFWVKDTLVMVMELVPGDSLENLHSSGLVPLRDGIDYICQALSALHFAHGKGVTHRDISPSNMLITPEGKLKLTDFGLALIKEDPRITQTGIVLGSAHYISPEQVQTKSTVDHRADIYSIGVVLYELATNQKPFDAPGQFDVMEAHLSKEPAPPIELNRSLPKVLSDAILKAMAKQRQDRFQSAEEFRLVLVRITQTSSASARVARTAEEEQQAAAMRRPPGRYMRDQDRAPASLMDRLLRSTTVQVGVGLAAAFLFIYLSALSLRPPVEPLATSELAATAQAASNELQAAEQAETGELPRAGAASTLDPPPAVASPQPSVGASGGLSLSEGEQAGEAGGTRLPQSGLRIDKGYFGSGGSGVEVWSSNPDPSASGIRVSGGHTLLRTVSMENPVQVLALSPDGRWAAAGMADHSVRIWEAGTGNRATTLRGHDNRISSMGFSPDGDMLATGSWDGTAKVWDLSTTRQVAMFGHADYVTAVAFSPDGQWLATGCSDKSVKIWNLRDPRRTQPFGTQSRTPHALAFSPTGAFLASVSIAGDVRLWNVGRGNSRGQLAGPESGADALAFSPDGRTLAVTGKNELKLFDFSARREKLAVNIPGWLHALTFSGEGRFLVLSALSQPADTVKLWDISSRKTLTTLHHDKTVRSIALSAGARRLATAADGGGIAISQSR